MSKLLTPAVDPLPAGGMRGKLPETKNPDKTIACRRPSAWPRKLARLLLFCDHQLRIDHHDFLPPSVPRLIAVAALSASSFASAASIDFTASSPWSGANNQTTLAAASPRSPRPPRAAASHRSCGSTRRACHGCCDLAQLQWRRNRPVCADLGSVRGSGGPVAGDRPAGPQRGAGGELLARGEHHLHRSPQSLLAEPGNALLQRALSGVDQRRRLCHLWRSQSDLGLRLLPASLERPARDLAESAPRHLGAGQSGQ